MSEPKDGDLWRFIALLQYKIEKLTEDIDILQLQMKSVQDDIRENGEVFCELDRVCIELENSDIE